MARAMVTITCKHCGKDFTHINRNCHNRTEANNYEDWAKQNIDMCPECRRKEIEKDNASKAQKIAEEYNLPKIKGVSEKQTAFADKLRNAYISQYPEKIAKASRMIKAMNRERMAQKASEQGMSAEEYILMAFDAYRVKEAYIILTCDLAAQIIDTLK